MAPSIGICEDDADLRSVVERALTDEGFTVKAVATGREALKAFATTEYDALVLDVGLPDADGRDVCQALRAGGVVTPVLFLTARDAVVDRVAGFRAGGDDYLTKPFGVAELLVRARILARTSARVASAPSGIVVGDMVLDEDARTVTRSGSPIELTPTEFELLRYLARNANRVLSREHILTNVWGMDFGSSSNLVDMYVSYLRKKLDVGRSPLVQTVRGAGYVLRP